MFSNFNNCRRLLKRERINSLNFHLFNTSVFMGDILAECGVHNEIK